jgi:hypothetical protein
MGLDALQIQNHVVNIMELHQFVKLLLEIVLNVGELLKQSLVHAEIEFAQIIPLQLQMMNVNHSFQDV